ncbi:MAG: NAD(P)H-binding protein [Pseudomonadales bacterium]|nr:NAD(P)H-binding protein [Pseudomonadales bacterium]MBO6565998.1 NAD(P)H-binding protein [Pseudomonadales bacterium]MBO6595642.1 NAD(P)H-binding protein [Pseudomonadales bacterium]MBO6655711.1 NAD(P)H-binding protein [Pseudomonadales bacterium]MBO6702142.1 NAD(P)H-binding protein [Pseudomonadales bacterium]
MHIAITGANGHLGLKLIRRLLEAGDEVRPIVRSEHAAGTIRGGFPDVDVRVVDYSDSQGLGEACDGCDTLVHLVGVIKESKANSFEQAHEAPCRALVAANLSLKHVVYLGIVGTDMASSNACLQSRARAETHLRQGDVPVTILRVPMVLGPDDYASMSLRRNGQKSMVIGFRTASLEQPIYSGDVVSAMYAATRLKPKNRTLDLAGPESLSRAQLIKRAGKCFGNDPNVVSLPIILGYSLAFLFELLSSAPPVTRAMLGVLDHDDDIDNQLALDELGMQLTSLDDTLQAVLLAER